MKNQAHQAPLNYTTNRTTREEDLMDEGNSVGEKIRNRRELLGMSIETLAFRLTVDAIAIEKLETRKRVAIKLLKRIARIMQIQVKDITELSDEEFLHKHRNKIADYVNGKYRITKGDS